MPGSYRLLHPGSPGQGLLHATPATKPEQFNFHSNIDLFFGGLLLRALRGPKRESLVGGADCERNGAFAAGHVAS